MNWLARASRSLAALCLSVTALGAQGAYSSLTFFGDSLSDTGNLYQLSGQTFPPSPPYYDGRRSDGPLWVEHLAAGLGLPGASAPLAAGGSNFSIIGALSGQDGYGGLTDVGLLSQVFAYWPALTGGVVDPGGLYVIGIGANDLFVAVESDSGMDAAAIAQREGAVDEALDNLGRVLTHLAGKGARQFLVANVPDLSLVPEALALGTSAAYDQTTRYFNTHLGSRLDTFRRAFAVGVAELDFYGIARAVTADASAGGQQYGLSNAVEPCLAPGAPECSVSMYVDGVHPTAAMHAIVGRVAMAQVSEPASVALLLIGFFALSFRRRHA